MGPAMFGKFPGPKHGIFLLAIGCAVSGCAQTPDKVLAYSVSDESYRTMECDRLEEEASRLNLALDSEYVNQRKARSDDAAGVFFLGLPVASMSGKNRSDEIARLKGELNAIESTANTNGCESVATSIVDARTARDKKKK